VISLGDFTLDTKAGPLVVHAYGDWIPTRFEDPELGAMHVGASLSGKWNWYPSMAGVERGKYDKDRKTLALFLERLRPILLAPGSPRVHARSPDTFDREVHRALIGGGGARGGAPRRSRRVVAGVRTCRACRAKDAVVYWGNAPTSDRELTCTRCGAGRAAKDDAEIRAIVAAGG
jgi:Zn ribbon nucleic-acid-binding protein